MQIEQIGDEFFYYHRQYAQENPLSMVGIRLQFEGGKRVKTSLAQANLDYLLYTCVKCVKIGIIPRPGETVRGFGSFWRVENIEHDADGELSILFHLKLKI